MSLEPLLPCPRLKALCLLDVSSGLIHVNPLDIGRSESKDTFDLLSIPNGEFCGFLKWSCEALAVLWHLNGAL